MGSARRLDWLTGVAMVVIALGVIQLTLGTFEVGVTVDEPVHTDRTQTLLDSGWYIPGGLLEDGEPSSRPIATPFVYGPGFSMPAHLAARTLGIDGAGVISEERGAWIFRHLIVAMIALLTALVVGLCVKKLTHSRRAAIWSAAALLCIPIWLGSGMFNIKDVPVAAGYTFFTTGLVVSATGSRSLSKAGFRAVIALCAVGILLSVGVRFAMWVALAASVLIWLALILGQRKWRGVAIRSRAKAVGYGGLIGLVLVVALYPAAFSNPADLLVGSIQDSSSYPHTGSTLTAGTLISSESPGLFYLPLWTFAVFPIAIGCFAVVGLIAWLGNSFNSARESGFREFVAGPVAPVVLVFVQLTLLPVGAAVSGATLYSGIRQHLFIFPALAIFAGYGLAFLLGSKWMTVDTRSWRRPALVIVACLALVIPLIEQSRLFPYNYSYINPVAGIGGVNGRWETDYWRASAREAAERIPAGATVACIPSFDTLSFTNCEKNSVQQFLPAGASPFDPEKLPEESVNIPLSLATLKKADGLESCQIGDEVTRPLRFEEVVMSRTILCDAQEVASRFLSRGRIGWRSSEGNNQIIDR